MNAGNAVSLLRQTFKEWNEDKASRLAASLSYYTAFSIPPLLLIAIAIAGRFFGQEQVQNELVSVVSNNVTPAAGEVVGQAVENADQPTGSLIATIVGVAVLIFTASGVFVQLQDAMNTIWNVEPAPDRGIMGTVKDRLFSFTIVLGVGFLLLVSLIISSLLAAFNTFVSGLFPNAQLIAQIINFVVSFGIITLLFALIFKYIPDVEIRWSDVWIGAAATALLFTSGKWALGLYLANSAPGSVYGAAGSILVLLAWVYYSAQIVFFGAEFTQVYARRYGERIEPSENAVALTEERRIEQGIPHQETVERKWAESQETETAAG